MRNYFRRLQPQASPRAVILAGLGGALAIGAASLPAQLSGVPLLMAPFGATCVLLFSAAASPFSQPANVIFGHILAAMTGLVFVAIFPGAWWAAALAVGLAIALMAAFRITHPPAGANPLVIFAAEPGLDFLITPVASGAVLLVLVAVLFHRLTGTNYPHPLD